MSTDETVSFSLEVNLKETYTGIRRVQTLVYGLLGLLRRLGLPEDLERGIITFQRFIVAANQARLAAIALQTAAGPVGWGLAAVSIGVTVLSASDTLMELRTR